MNSDTLSAKDWALTNSSIGGRKCLDFSENDKSIFTSRRNDKGVFELIWPTVRKQGKITLSTVFFTPLQSINNLRITPINLADVKLNSYDYLRNSSSIMLNNYDYVGQDYSNLRDTFKLVGDESLCISENNSEISLFWNRDYLEKIQYEINSQSGNSCN